MKKKVIIGLVLAVLLAMTVGFAYAAGGDPTGANLGTVKDITSAVAGKPTLEEVATQVAKNKLGINFVWVMLTAFLIFFFQAGFALVETGFTQAKNAMHTMA
ncbi:MAG: ammonium transporter, Amt family, partial [Thermoanaerobacterium sp.]|nr:ammonium transporter, Amt family [Thermoanaerobacterium sp.]